MADMTITITIPLPPPTNSLYINLPKGKGRAKSAKYARWIPYAGAVARHLAAGKRIGGLYSFTMYLPDGIRGDWDSRLKAGLDLLAAFGITDDDRFCRDIHILWRPKSFFAEKDTCTISVCEWKKPVSD